MCFSGTLSKTRSELERDARAAGMTVSSGCRKRTTHLVTSENEVCARTRKVGDALKYGTFVVSEAWLTESIRAGACADETQSLLVEGSGEGPG